MSDTATKKLMIIEFGGKQHLAEPGSRFVANQSGLKEGEMVEAKDLLTGQTVKLKVLGLFLDKKINGLKFKSKSRYTRRYGHRQPLMTMEVISGGTAAVAEKTKTKPATKTVAKSLQKTVAKKAAEKAVAKQPAKKESK